MIKLVNPLFGLGVWQLLVAEVGGPKQDSPLCEPFFRQSSYSSWTTNQDTQVRV